MAVYSSVLYTTLQGLQVLHFASNGVTPAVIPLNHTGKDSTEAWVHLAHRPLIGDSLPINDQPRPCKSEVCETK